MEQQVLFTNAVGQALEQILKQHNGTVFTLTDDNTRREVLPRMACDALQNATHITIPAGEQNKSLGCLASVWESLQQSGANRHSLLINIGGGMITDLGGLAASTFKRGISFVNVPTTLLGAVDAAVGGKTAINFGGLKNDIGLFSEASHVIVSTRFFDTLPQREILSGFAEMMKHALLDSREEFFTLLDTDFSAIHTDTWLPRLERSVQVKQRIVAQDPYDNDMRRWLNAGHTVGHAFESLAWSTERDIAHGYAVAWGLVVETVLARMMLKAFPGDDLQQLATFVRQNYGAFHITCDDYDTLLDFMRHDKKTRRGEINCTLLSDFGHAHADCSVTDEDMCAALDIYRDLMGI